ncbi:acyl-coenzyme A thioesterase PaaI-like protein [Aquabacterium commune]|uniref:Acyl-coenzyme A thioesterase PaaI-like protein n=1 Tax=Aquabacterium commune TaxID=70586 RepID=A0A4R6R6E3_9BURK|nr:PaaI family thioesterase [Aquabacterium commune]TDP81225.1 acyl-coenzyme A thioesterase PaaI-like protein [Aquabacterium commune]
MSIFTGNHRQAWAEAFIAGIPYAVASGMTLVETGPGQASLLLPARSTWTGDAERQLIHPGCLSVLADTACGVAVGCALEELEPFATLDLRMDYLRPPVAETDLVCRAECHRLSRSVAFVRGELTQPGQSEPVATVYATFMRATAATRRQDVPAQTPRPTPSQAASTLMSPASIEPSQVFTSVAADLPETLAVPTGRSPYVDFLNVHQQPQIDAGPVFRMPYKPELIGNPVLPALHGGILAGFGETAMILHLLATNPGMAGIPRSVDFAIAYMRSAKPIDTFAQSTTVRQGNRVALVMVSLWQDDPQRPVVQARGHFLMPRDDA